MNKTLKNIVLILVLVIVSSCSKILEEEPKSLLTAKYLETTAGVNSALYSCYSDLRFFYGGESAMSMTVAGTDEFQRGPDGSSGLNLYSNSELLTNGQVGTTWNWGYTAINTANAVIKFAPTCGMPSNEAKYAVAQAKFLRALWYLNMVQMYGAMPLNLEFISEPKTEAIRTPVPEVYAAIISDLEAAKSDVPARPPQQGRVWAGAVYHLLAKAYLTRAAHPVAKQATDYQKAYEAAMVLINGASGYGLALLKDFADVHKPRNEFSSEIIFTAERNKDATFNDMDPNINGNKNNRSSFFFRPNYSTWVKGLVRDIPNGRPWHRIRPTNYLLEVAFLDRTDDTRYDKTFQTVWLVNDAASLENPAFKAGDTAAWMPGYETYRTAKALKIYTPSQYFGNPNNAGNLSMYPSMKKYDDIDRPTIPDASVRPFIIFRFAETYLIAAEAAMYLGNGQARNLVNVVRTRAGFLAGRSDGANAMAVSRLTGSTPALAAASDAGLNFLLEERSRELCGEYMRWFDLARTRNAAGLPMLMSRLRTLTPDIPCKATIQDHHILRPIPQAQIDLTTNKDFLQNPGY